MVWSGLVWSGLVWYGMVWYGMVWYGMVWYGMVWYGMVWYGMVWYAFSTQGPATPGKDKPTKPTVKLMSSWSFRLSHTKTTPFSKTRTSQEALQPFQAPGRTQLLYRPWSFTRLSCFFGMYLVQLSRGFGRGEVSPSAPFVEKCTGFTPLCLRT